MNNNNKMIPPSDMSTEIESIITGGVENDKLNNYSINMNKNNKRNKRSRLKNIVNKVKTIGMKLVHTTMSLIAPRVITGSFGVDPNISSLSIMKVAFRTYDNKCFNTEFIRGYYIEFVSRYITNRGIIPSEVDVNGIVDSIIEIRNASFEAYSAILSFSRKYSCSKLKSVTGDQNFGKAFSNDVVDLTRNVPTIANVQPIYDQQYSIFDYSDLKISRSVWMSEFQSLFSDFYLTKSAISQADDIFKDYIQLKEIGDVSIILDCFPEYCVSDYLNRIRMLHSSCTRQFSKYPSLRGILTELKYINLRPICNEIHNDLSKTELRIKYDNGSFSNTVYNWPYTWLTTFDPSIPWIQKDNYVPDPFNLGLDLRRDVPSAPDLAGKLFDETEDLRRMLEFGKKQEPTDDKTKLYDSVLKILPTQISDINTDDKVKSFRLSITDIFTDKPEELFSPLIVGKYTEILNLITTVDIDMLTVGIPGKQVAVNVFNFANRAMRTASSPPFIKAAATIGGPVLSAASFASEAAFRLDNVKRILPTIWKLKDQEKKNTIFPRNKDESDKDYMDRVKRDYNYVPTFSDKSGLSVYSLKYLRSELFKVTDVVSEFDHNIDINEFANMDRFRFLRPTSHVSIHLNRTGSSFDYVASQIIINGSPTDDPSQFPDTIDSCVNFSKIISDSHIYASRNMFNATYTFSKEVNKSELKSLRSNNSDWRTNYSNKVSEVNKYINDTSWPDPYEYAFITSWKRFNQVYKNDNPRLTMGYLIYSIIKNVGTYTVSNRLQLFLNAVNDANNVYVEYVESISGYEDGLQEQSDSLLYDIKTKTPYLLNNLKPIVWDCSNQIDKFGGDNPKWLFQHIINVLDNWNTYDVPDGFDEYIWYPDDLAKVSEFLATYVDNYTPPKPKPVVGNPDYNYVLATCTTPGSSSTQITVNEDMNSVWIEAYNYYREVCRMEFFHPNASEEIRKNLDSIHRYEPQPIRYN